MGNLLWLIIVILIILWLGGFAFHFGGGLIHILLVIALIVLIFQLVTGRRAP
ncbi:MAG TPA: lmo0937 family membrane protein [Thermoanaerobaculia bacterium]|nr:lmo0937 family membrane protein [Thermoanaerobaculia bacterium]